MKRPRILFVAMTDSTHTARWLAETRRLGYDIHIFPSDSLGINPGLCDASLHGFYVVPGDVDRSLRFDPAFPLLKSVLPNRLNILIDRFRRLFLGNGLAPKGFRARQLARVIEKVRPDLIHALEMQHAGYLVLAAKGQVEGAFPPLMYTPWGSDIFLYGRFPDHADRIRAVLSSCDYYCPHSDRDIRLAREFGFSGEVLPKIDGTGGFDTENLRTLWQAGRCSGRNLILIKGYQGTLGRALVAFRALGLCRDVLKGFSVTVYLAGDDVRAEARQAATDIGIPVAIHPYGPYEEVLALFLRARVSIGLSMSDGVPNSMLEAMVSGAFPIESDTSCADEWIVNGENGCIVPPEDVEAVARAIRRAVTDDELVDRAAGTNYGIMRRRADRAVIGPKVAEMYRHVLKQ